MSKNYYFIDTENVGNRWFDIPHKIHKKDKIITFYTENHSKRLEKFLSKQIHNPKILWLECSTGCNALDYQLIGVLSYLIAKHPKASFCIYSNDKDYHAAIDFWKSRGIKICQKSYEVSNKKKAKKKKAKADKEKILVQGKLSEEQYVAEIAKSIPTSNLMGWHQALTAIFGQEKGRSWYLKIRDDTELKTTLAKHCMSDGYSRGVNLVATTLNMYDLDVTKAEEAYKIIQSHNPKNLNAIKIDFDKKFDKNQSQNYYHVLRPLIRTIKEK